MSAYPDHDSTGFDPVQTINDYADYYGVPADLAQAVMQRESGGNHYDRDGNVLTSSRGYRGLMQMHPITAAGLGLGFNVNDPEENVHAGLKSQATAELVSANVTADAGEQG
jgi:soluble lytic murein transglycosylase-like protein